VNRALAVAAASCALLAMFSLAPAVSAQNDKNSAVRTLVGQVIDDSDRPVASAIVYLKNTKDLTVKTYIADNQGNYRFNALSMNSDYEVHAESKDGRSSEVRRLSSFDSRKLVHLNLRLK
jgi:hypothetical protein